MAHSQHITKKQLQALAERTDARLDSLEAMRNIDGMLKGDGTAIVPATPGTDYATPADVRGYLNRQTNVDAADTNYSALMARGIGLSATEQTPTVNGAILFQYG